MTSHHCGSPGGFALRARPQPPRLCGRDPGVAGVEPALPALPPDGPPISSAFANVTRNRQASTAAQNQRAASIRWIVASAMGRPARWANWRMLRATEVLHNSAIVGRLGGEVPRQLEPDRLGDIKIGRAGPGRETAEALEVGLRGHLGAGQAPQLGARDPRRIAHDQQGTAPSPVQVAAEVDLEEVCAGDRHPVTATAMSSHPVTRGPAMRRLDFNGVDLAGRRRMLQQPAEKVPLATRRLEYSRPTRADRPQGVQHRGHELGRSLEVTKVPSHPFPFPVASCQLSMFRRSMQTC